MIDQKVVWLVVHALRGFGDREKDTSLTRLPIGIATYKRKKIRLGERERKMLMQGLD